MIVTENNSVVKRREVLKNDPPREPKCPEPKMVQELSSLALESLILITLYDQKN